MSKRLTNEDLMKAYADGNDSQGSAYDLVNYAISIASILIQAEENNTDHLNLAEKVLDDIRLDQTDLKDLKDKKEMLERREEERLAYEEMHCQQ